MVFLAVGPVFGAAIAKAVDFVVGQYKKILEIKKLQLEIERLQLPDEISAKTKEHANTLMEAEIDKFTVEIMNEYPLSKDDGRKNELRTAVKMSLDMIANRIDRGFNFEVRSEPLTDKKLDENNEVSRAVQAIQAASINMQYLKLEGPPILALPEKIESAGREGADHAEEAKPKKGGRPKKTDAN
jgi:hypothetical protein